MPMRSSDRRVGSPIVFRDLVLRVELTRRNYEEQMSRAEATARLLGSVSEVEMGEFFRTIEVGTDDSKTGSLSEFC
jgi:hypothetical protein